MLATAKSQRATSDRELVNWACLQDELTAARITAQAQTKSGDLRIEMSLTASQMSTENQIQKRIKINSVPRRAIDLVGQLSIVLFTSQDIELIDGAPSRRRRYLDLANSQISSKYLYALQHYNKVLLQRNHLLRRISERDADEGQLAFWDDELVEHGSYIIEQRRTMVDELNKLAPPIHSAISSGEALRITYLPSVDAGDFRNRLAEVRPKELLQHMSLVGPHRDDLAFLINDINISTYGSRGQQRTVALSLKLAEASYLKEKIGDEPVILLDDVLSELDATRRRQLLESVTAYNQVIITTTDIDCFELGFLSNSAQYKVSAGTIEPV